MSTPQDSPTTLLRKRLLGCAFLLALLISPFYQFLAAPLVLRDPLTRADAIVILGGGVDLQGNPSGSTRERVYYGVALYKEGFAPALVLSTGVTDLFNEAQVMREYAVSLGVPEQDIVLEESSRNTYENVLSVHRLFQEKQWKQAIVVSSPYHMRRIAMIYEKAFPEASPLYAPVRPSLFYENGPLSERFRQAIALYREYMAIAWYWMKGRV